jgi:outer membrane lipoprotein-sorting protein
MRIQILSLIVSLLLAAPLIHAAETATPEQIAQWVKDLGAESFETRTSAQEKLRGTGESGKAELEKAATGTNADLRSRASRMLGILKTQPLLNKAIENTLGAKGMAGQIKASVLSMGQLVKTTGTFKTSSAHSFVVMDSTTEFTGKKFVSKVVCDGTYLWSEARIGKDSGFPEGTPSISVTRTSLEKIKRGNSVAKNPLDHLAEMRKMIDFTNVSEGFFDTHEVYIFEGVPKEYPKDYALPLSMQNVKRASMSLDKSGLFVRQIKMMDVEDKIICNIEITNVEAGLIFPESTFKYTPTEGIMIKDTDGAIEDAKDKLGRDSK